MKDFWMALLMILWDASLLVGCSYLVIEHGFSPWWYVAALLIMWYPKDSEE